MSDDERPSLEDVQRFVLGAQHVLHRHPDALRVAAEQAGIWTEPSVQSRRSGLDGPRLRCIERPFRGPDLVIPLGHAVRSLSPVRGTDLLLAAAGQDVFLVSTSTGQVLRQFSGHTQEVTCVADLGGGHFASGGYDRRVVVWNLDSNRPVWSSISHAGVPTCMSGFGDGRFVTASDLGEVLKWTATGGLAAPECRLQRHWHEYAACLEGDRFATLSQDAVLALWDWSTDEALAELRFSDVRVTGLCALGDGRIACALNPRELVVIKIEGDRLVKEKTSMWEGIESLAVDPVTGPVALTDSGLFCFWSYPQLERSIRIGNGDSSSSMLAPLPGSRLATGGPHHEVRVWSRDRLVLAGDGRSLPFTPVGAGYTDDGRVVLLTDTGAVEITFREWSRPTHRSRGWGSRWVGMECMASQWILACSDNGFVGAFGSETGVQSIEHKLSARALFGVCAVGDDHFVVADRRGNFWVFSVHGFRILEKTSVEQFGVLSVLRGFSKDFLAVSHSGYVFHWTFRGPGRRWKVLRPEFFVNCGVAWDDDTALLGCSDGTLWSLDLPSQTFKPFDESPGPEHRLMCALGTSGFATVAADGVLRVRRFGSGGKTVEVPLLFRATCLAANRDGSEIAIGNSQGGLVRYAVEW